MTDPAELDLRDIHLPAEPGWWPPAPGWWLLLALAAAAAIAAFLWWRRHRAERVRRLAFAELDALRERCAGEPARLPAELSRWLRRVTLSLVPRGEVAGLTGEAWLATLQRLSPGSRLPRDYSQMLLEGPYAPSPAAGAHSDALIAACREWARGLELHRRDGAGVPLPRRTAG